MLAVFVSDSSVHKSVGLYSGLAANLQLQYFFVFFLCGLLVHYAVLANVYRSLLAEII